MGPLNDQTNQIIRNKKFIENNPKTVLLDVRTEDEWKTVGKPETKRLGIKTILSQYHKIQVLLENIKKEINKENQVLVMCAAGGRSIIAATLLQMKVILLTIFQMDLVVMVKILDGKIQDYLLISPDFFAKSSILDLSKYYFLLYYFFLVSDNIFFYSCTSF